MSSTSSDTSLSTKANSGGSSENQSLCNESNEKVTLKEPGPIEKQIEEYLKNWDPKSRFKKRKETESGCDKEASDHESIICMEDVSTRYLTPEEAAYFQPQYMYAQPQISPKMMGQYPGTPWLSSIPLNKPGDVKEFSKSETPLPNLEDSIKTEVPYASNTRNMPQYPYYINYGTQKSGSSPPYGAMFVDPNKRGTYANYAGYPCMNEEFGNVGDSVLIGEQEDKINSLTQEVETLTEQNEELRKQLEKQEAKMDSLGPRYKYLEENFEDFIKMKDEYLRLKHEKRRELGLKEMSNKFVQTWSTTVMCQSCIKTHEMLRNSQIRSLINLDKEAFCVSKTELSELTAKFRALKENISERERDYENRGEKAELIHLTALNVGYRSRIIELETKNRQILHWADALQKIIAKVYSEQNASTLTTPEEKWVERILNKFAGISEECDSASVVMDQEALDKKLFNVEETSSLKSIDYGEVSIGE